ncbi:proline racemase family protein [Frigoriglobus tundricola]|uniref:4-hydroxyproline epimerase n=1 Tax=Frigoriglobus tundricola TaxID=2774151 RepID=A0A6M5YVA6_9BACT|nr:proline racemase family protein [Frigoriglobus tundricola]QJW97173.1 4-hydroxyproline epimerase [Frigoriglobus tundricola]
MQQIHVIDSHTGGEPTRVVVTGGPFLGTGPMAERAEALRQRFDTFRSCVVNEPRGSDVLVGALLCEPHDPASAAGVIFFNNVGVLGMCGHGTIGLAVTLAHLGRIRPGEHRLETTVGPVSVALHDGHRVTVRNVPSYRRHAHVTVNVPGLGPVTGDIAWGGNWFFLVKEHPEEIRVGNVDRLTDVAWRIRQAVNAAFPEPVDHVELFGPPADAANHSRNFVLCPGKAYDRSPCGTGTSAKLACLFADGKLAPGEVWRQESVTGSVFEGTVEPTGEPGVVVPSITGTAYITAEATLLVDPTDPLRDGIRG